MTFEELLDDIKAQMRGSEEPYKITTGRFDQEGAVLMFEIDGKRYKLALSEAPLMDYSTDASVERLIERYP